MAKRLLLGHDDEVCVVVDGFTRREVLRSEDDAAALQDALNAAAGGTVEIEPGDYRMASKVVVPAQTRVKGCGQGTKLRAIHPIPAMLVLAEADRSMVSGLTVLGQGIADVGVLVQQSGLCEIRDTMVVGFRSTGIHVTDGSFCCGVRNCTAASNGERNIALTDLAASRVGDFLPNTVSDCLCLGGGVGIDACGAIVVNITGCSVVHAIGVGYRFRKLSNSLLINGCRSYQIQGTAIEVDSTHEFNCTGNIFCWHTGDGIVLRDVAWGTISGNEVIDTGSLNLGGPNFTKPVADIPEDFPGCDAIRVERSRGIQIAGNTLFNWELAPPIRAGVRLASSHHCGVSNNNINFAQAGILDDNASNQVVNNVFCLSPCHFEYGKYLQTFEIERTQRFIEELARP